MKFTDENKQVKEFSDQNWFGFGVHKVAIVLIELGNTNPDEPEKGKEFVEFTVAGENGEEDTARMWFTSDKAANFSFNVCRQIYVHNAPEAAKDAARDTMDAVKDTTELVEKMTEKLIGKECWFTKYPDPTRTYLDSNNNTRQSINKNVYGYEPKLREDLMPKDGSNGTSDPLAGAEKVEPGSDAAAGIPKNW